MAHIHTEPGQHDLTVSAYIFRADFDERHNHIGIDYVFVAREEPRHATGEGESLRTASFTRTELAALPEGEIFASTREIGLHIFDKILMSWKRVSASS